LARRVRQWAMLKRRNVAAARSQLSPVAYRVTLSHSDVNYAKKGGDVVTNCLCALCGRSG